MGVGIWTCSHFFVYLRVSREAARITKISTVPTS
jgi:hypothetical protein